MKDTKNIKKFLKTVFARKVTVNQCNHSVNIYLSGHICTICGTL